MQKKTFQTFLYSAMGVAAMAVVLVALNFIFSGVRARIDLTNEKAFTLSAGTRAILRKLDTPVKVRFYCSRNQSGAETVYVKEYARRVEDLLDEYKQIAGEKLVVEKLDPTPDSNAEDSARLDGVEGQDLPNGEKFYLGIAVSMLDEKQAIPFLNPGRERLLEYDLSRAIARVATPERPIIGIMSPMPVFGAPANPMMQQMGQPGQETWGIVTELKNDFTVKRVEMDTDQIGDDIKVLFLIHPRGISETAQYAIDQFILRGGKLIALLDPFPLMDTKQRDPMLGNMPNPGSSLPSLLRAWGLQFDTSRVVADANFMLQISGRGGQPTDAPAILGLTTDGIDQDDIATSQVDDAVLAYAGAFTGTPAAGLKETVLLKSTRDSQLVEGFMAQLSGENIMKEFKASGTNYALAVRLSGKFKTGFPNGRPAEEKPGVAGQDEKTAEKKPDNSLKESKEENTVVLVGDADIVFDQIALQRVGPMLVPRNGNFAFTQNAVEQLTGDSNLISIRSRATQNRPLTRIRTMQEKAREAYQTRINELEASLAETQQRLNDLQQVKQGTQRFILSAEQQAELDNFRRKRAEVNLQLRAEQKKLRQDIDALEQNVKWANIGTMPLLVSLSGIVLAFYKSKRTSAK